jgi:hypothetical protein
MTTRRSFLAAALIAAAAPLASGLSLTRAEENKVQLMP